MKGYLSLNFERRGHHTVMTHNHSAAPLQASNGMRLDDSGALCVTLLNLSGGLLGGDCLTTDVALGKDAHVVLTTSSATKVYRSNTAQATLKTTVYMAENAVLEYVPDHLIPHPGSSLSQSLTVNMEHGSRAIILDAFSVGRISRKEKWLFRELATDLKVSRSGHLVCRDRIRIQPETWIPLGLGGLEDGNYLATMCLFADHKIDWPKTANSFTAWFSKGQGSVGASSPLAAGGCLIRYYANSAHNLKKATDVLWAMARGAILGQPPLDLRKG